MKNTVFALGFWILIAWVSNSGWAQERLPVVFVHGLGIPTTAYEALYPLKWLFHEAGHELIIADVPLASSLDERARILDSEVTKRVPLGRFHLVGHSMGGLDARLAIHRSPWAARVASLTTLATPHHGSPLADYVVKNLWEGGLVSAFMRLFGDSINAAKDLTSENMSQIFNAEVQDDPRIRYFSLGFYIPEPVQAHSRIPWLWFAHQIVSAAGDPENDGMVSVESSKWGKFLGALPGDHYSETGPIPFAGGVDYLEVFQKVIENLEKNAEN